jgi:hypothetical protein
MPRANDPLACLLYLIAHNSLPFGTVDALVHRALSEIAPDMPADDPLVAWAAQQADLLRNP